MCRVDGLQMAIHTDRYLRDCICSYQSVREPDFHSFAYGNLPPSALLRRGCPGHTDQDMHGCRIDLRREFQEQQNN